MVPICFWFDQWVWHINLINLTSYSFIWFWVPCRLINFLLKPHIWNCDGNQFLTNNIGQVFKLMRQLYIYAVLHSKSNLRQGWESLWKSLCQLVVKFQFLFGLFLNMQINSNQTWSGFKVIYAVKNRISRFFSWILLNGIPPISIACQLFCLYSWSIFMQLN